MAIELVRHSDSRLDRHQLGRFIESYQTVAPLTIGELWAWPIMLKLALVENPRSGRPGDAGASGAHGRRSLRRADRRRRPRAPASAAALGRPCLRRATAAARARVRPPPLGRALRRRGQLSAQQTAAEEAIRSEHRRQAAAQVSVANVITSLRLASTLDWSQYFESVSLVEGVLRRDPAGVYARMDFRSRDRYRQAVEDLSDGSGESQLRVALRTVERVAELLERLEVLALGNLDPCDRCRTRNRSSGGPSGSRRSR
jgi:cyclic beta-1,2-glucan synthetase